MKQTNKITDMTGIPRPLRCHVDEFGRTTFYFPDSSAGVFIVRGGVCFGAGIGISGFIVLCGQDLHSQKIYVFEEKEFTVIDNVIDTETGVILHEGISTWLNKNSKLYRANTYYHTEDNLNAKRHRMQVFKSLAINPKPYFEQLRSIVPRRTKEYITRVGWEDGAQARQTVWEQLNQKKLFYRDAELAKQLQQANSQTEQLFPAVEALTAAINGFIDFPYVWRGEGMSTQKTEHIPLAGHGY